MQQTDLSRAIAFHQQGRAQDAIPLYRNFLRANRKHIGAANLLVVALMQAGRLEEAVEAGQRALQLDPSQASTHYNLGTILQRLNRDEQAIGYFETAVKLNPKDFQAYNNLGVVLKALGRSNDAIGAFRKAKDLRPDFVEAHSNLASALSVTARYDEAIEAAKKALEIDPGLAEAYLTIGNALVNQEKTIEALEAFDKAIKLQPHRYEAYYCAGNALMSIHFEDRAVEHFRLAILLNPDSAAAHFMLAICLHSLNRYDEAAIEAEKALALLEEGSGDAETHLSAGKYLLLVNLEERALAHFERVLSFDPNSGTAILNRAKIMAFLHREEEALRLVDRVIARKPDSQELKSVKAMTALSIGQFREGWDLYEDRFSEESALMLPLRKYSVPRWDGQPLSEPLLIWGEQGIGAEILHASILPDAIRRAAQIVLEVEPRLIPLFKRSFPMLKIRALTPEVNEDSIAVHSPIGSLGRFFRQSWEDFPRSPYLVADRERAGRLRDAVHANERCVIGISWRSTNSRTGHYKTAHLQDFAPLLRQPALGFVDLQYGDTAADLQAVRDELAISIQHIDEIDNKEDIDGLAALIEACDAVVTISNATAHVAGALGKPVWILIPRGQGRHWYWFKDRKDSPWYPGARIVRQQPGQSWADLVASIVPEISEFARGLQSKA
jgi:tetratricopeptide (TPR) repeat protein